MCVGGGGGGAWLQFKYIKRNMSIISLTFIYITDVILSCPEKDNEEICLQSKSKKRKTKDNNDSHKVNLPATMVCYCCCFSAEFIHIALP